VRDRKTAKAWHQLTLPGVTEAPASALAREREALAARAETDARTRKAKAEEAALALRGRCDGRRL
jgi:hypothetical protein